MAKIPKRGANPALKKILKKNTAKMNVEEGINAVRREMQATANSAKPIKEFINDTLVGNPSSRGTNRKMSSEKTMNKVFKTSKTPFDTVDLEDAIEKSKKEYDNIQSTAKASKKEAAKSYSGRYSNPSMNENRATRNIVNQNNMKPLWKPDTVKNSNIKKEARQIKIDDRAQAYNELSKQGYDPASNSAQLAAEKRAKEIKNERIKGYHSKSNSLSEKDNKFFNQKNIRRGVGVGVTGALVLSMFNNGGQQSNAELYGQQQQRY